MVVGFSHGTSALENSYSPWKWQNITNTIFYLVVAAPGSSRCKGKGEKLDSPVGKFHQFKKISVKISTIGTCHLGLSSPLCTCFSFDVRWRALSWPALEVIQGSLLPPIQFSRALCGLSWAESIVTGSWLTLLNNKGEESLPIQNSKSNMSSGPWF